MPAAYLGGIITADRKVFLSLLAITLMAAAFTMLRNAPNALEHGQEPEGGTGHPVDEAVLFPDDHRPAARVPATETSRPAVGSIRQRDRPRRVGALLLEGTG